MVKIEMSTSMVQKMVDTYDGFSDDVIKSCKFISKAGIKALFEVETDLDADKAAAYIKKHFKNTHPEAIAMYFSIQPAR